MNRWLRIAAVAVIGLLELAAFITILATFNAPVAQFGYNLGPDARTVVSVVPHLPADRAGIAPGDVIAFERLSVAGRINAVLNEVVSPGTSVTMDVSRGGAVRIVTLRPVELPRLYGLSNLAFALGGLALGAIGLALVVLRPSLMTWGFAFVAPPLLIPDFPFRWSLAQRTGLGFAIECAVAGLYAMQATGMMIFASRFPNDTPRGLNRAIDALAVPVGCALAALYVYVNWKIWFSPSPPAPWTLVAQDYVAPAIAAVASIAALLATYVTSNGNERNRIAPALFAFAMLVATATAQAIGYDVTSEPGWLLAFNFAFAVSSILLAAAVAYGVVQHRVMDVQFIVGRALVYSILTLFAVAIFTLIEFFVGKLLEHNRLASVLEILAALAIGLSLNALHARLDRFIDRALFRRRHLAEARLERAAVALPHVESTTLVAEMLVDEPADAFELASAAVFALDDDERRYRRVRAAGWGEGDAAEFGLDDHLVLRLRAELKQVHLEELRWPRSDLPAGDRQPVYAVPIAIGNRLEAVALYGGPAGGEALDADERRSLRALARAAALAYDHLRVQALRKSLEETRNDNAALRRVEQTLTSLLEQRLSEP